MLIKETVLNLLIPEPQVAVCGDKGNSLDLDCSGIASSFLFWGWGVGARERERERERERD